MTALTPVVAVVPAKDRADTVGATVEGLLRVEGVDRVLVVDDGSRDATAEVARRAGARVLRLPVNHGKGGAVTAAVLAEPSAGVYLLVDADVGETAGLAERLLPPVMEGQADMTVAVLPAAGRKGGLGSVRRLAAAGIRRACGYDARAPLSGQRAVRGDLLRSVLPLAARFGMETAMTVDAVRAGARVREVDVSMEHRHTGRSLAGFRHRARQGADVVQALLPRLTTGRQRLAAAVLTTVLLAALAQAGAAAPAGLPPSAQARKVVLFGIPRLGWADVGTGRLPALDRLAEQGAIAAMSVRTGGGRPSTVEGYATLGAGSRVRAGDDGGDAFEASARVEEGTAAEVLARRTGVPPDGEVVVVGAPAVARSNAARRVGGIGGLGDAVRAAGRRTAVVSNADVAGAPGVNRPAALAVADGNGVVDAGRVGRSLLRRDASAPFGLRADHAAVMAAFDAALRAADVVLVDPGDTERAAWFGGVASHAAAARARARALASTDRLLADVAAGAGRDTLLLVVAVSPPGDEPHLTPVVAAGAGVRRGYLHSPAVRRRGLVTLTDVAPTVLDALGVAKPLGMIGSPLRYDAVPVSLEHLRDLDRTATFRERTYYPVTMTVIVVQALLYLLAALAFARLGGAGRAAPLLRWAVLGVAAFPLATFLLRALPGVPALGPAAVLLLLPICAAVVALARRARRHELLAFAWVCAATVAVLLLDVWTGSRLQLESLLGYSALLAARFTGLGNNTFAVLLVTALLAGCIAVHFAARRREALVAVALGFALVTFTDVAPALGADVGGILTMVPVFGLVLLALAGRRISWRTVAVAAAVTVVALVLVALVDYLRPAAGRTHLGDLVADVREGGVAPFLDVVQRKLAANVRTSRSPWTWTVPIVTAYLLWMLAWSRGFGRILPRGSALRVGAAGALFAGILGNVVNDSGVIITAMIFVYIGPYFTLLALQEEQGEPVLLEPEHRWAAESAPQ